MVLPDSLQRLRSLDRVSPQFYEQLGDLFRGDEYRNAVQSLQGEDLAWLVEYLDGVSLQTVSPPDLRSSQVQVIVGIPDPASPQFHESLNELGKLCGAKEVLPKSCTLRVKRVKVHQNGDPRKVREVRSQRHVLPPLVSNESIDLPSGGRGVETSGTPKHRPPSGCNR